MLNSTQAKVLTVFSAVALAMTVKAQVLIGGFQGAADPTDAGWINAKSGNPITSDSYCSFPAGVVPGYGQSLAITWASTNNGTFGYPSLELQFSPAQVQAFNSNSWITLTFSVPSEGVSGGYSQLYNIALNAPGLGYKNINQTGWTNAMFSGNTNNNAPEPNYYFSSSSPALMTQVVTINYSAFTNTIIAGGESYLQMTLQGNQGGGGPTNWYINSVVLSPYPFGQVSQATANVFTVDDFSTNGVGPNNPTNYDYFNSATQEVYLVGDITNVWGNWFGTGFTNLYWSANDANSNAASGSMAVQILFAGNNQFVIHHANYANEVGVSSLTYTSLQVDVEWPAGSAVSSAGTFGPLRFGVRPNGVYSVQDWFYTTNIPDTDTNWIHLNIPLPTTDPSLTANFGELLIGMDPTGTGLSGPSTLYVDNIKFVGPLVVPPPPPAPSVTLTPAKPGLRMFVGSSATYIREGVITTQGTGENESWVGSGVNYPAKYSFQLLSYPPANIGATVLAILPEASFSVTQYYQTTIYGNSFLDYQDSNGLYVTLAPYQGKGAVTAAVQWKVGQTSANATNTLFSITNSTAIGTWTLTMINATQGNLSGPGFTSPTFTISDPNVATDFANPAIATIFEDPNSSAGYGLYEDYGTISITGVASGNQTENFSNESSDFNGGTTSPGGFFQNTYSVDPANLVIARSGPEGDAYWFSWTQDLQGNYVLISGTNILSNPASWISPLFYAAYNISDETAPRGVGVQHGPLYWELLSADCVPTVDGKAQSAPPAINDAAAPNAYFMLTTNVANIYP